MEFFKKLSSLLSGTKKVTIIAQQVGDKITVGFFPEFASKDINEKVKMCSITGTPEEMDQGFFAEIRKPIEAASAGLKSNAEEVATEIKAAAEEELEDEKAEKERKEKAASKKSVPVKKAAPAKKPKAKKPEPEKKSEHVKKTIVPKKNVEESMKTDKFHEADLKETLIEEDSENTNNGNNSPETEIKTTKTEINEAIADIVDNRPLQDIQVKNVPAAIDDDILNPENQEPENLETVEEKKEDVVIPEVVIEPVQPTENTEESSNQSKFDQYMQEGEDHMKAKNYQLARTTFQNAMVLADASGNQANIGKAYKAEANAARWVRAIERMNS